MTLVEVRSSLQYTVQTPTSFVFNIAAQATEHQSIVEETVLVEPEADYRWTQVGDGDTRGLRLFADPGVLTVRYGATVRLTPQVDQAETLAENAHIKLPNAVLPYLNPSRYCESDRLVQLALDEFWDIPPGHGRVSAVCEWIQHRLTYQPDSTDALTTACDVLVQRTGVCRDYAHLAIAVCRALCIPARYVSGYAVGLQPPDFHGFFEAYLGSDWYLFDPTQKAPLTGLVRIGVGRDAADASFATIVGLATLDEMAVSARQMTDATPPGERGEPGAVSTA